MHNLSDYAYWYATHTPDVTALVSQEQRITYGALDRLISDLARSLLAAGVTPGDRVATFCGTTPSYLIAFLASARIGAVWLGLNTKYRLEELSYVLADAKPKVVLAATEVSGADLGGTISALRERHEDIEHWIALNEDSWQDTLQPWQGFLDTGQEVKDETLQALACQCGGHDPCLLVYTSGSTGKPKGALLHHAGIAQFSHMQNTLWHCDNQSLVNFLPINHVGCVVDLSMPVVIGGGKQVLMEQFDPSTALGWIEEEKLGQWFSVPSTFLMQLALPDFASFDLSSVELIAWGGAAMPRDTIEQLRELCPRLATNYGLTETLVPIAMAPTDEVEKLATSVGTPMLGVEVKVVAEDGSTCSPGTPGELWCRSEQNMLAYWANPDATVEAFSNDGWYKTGDILVENAQGEFAVVGRIKEMYKSGGYNVYPREVEDVLESHPAVSVAAVVPRDDPQWQEVGIAYLLAEPGMEINPEEIEAFAKTQLANYKIPKAIHVLEEMPLLPIGKVDKLTLRAKAAGGG